MGREVNPAWTRAPDGDRGKARHRRGRDQGTRSTNACRAGRGPRRTRSAARIRTPVMSDALPLSIILTGRNDGHGADFTARLLRALDFNHRHLSAAGVPHEFVLVEWNPVPGTPWLVDVVRSESPALGPVLRAYLV